MPNPSILSRLSAAASSLIFLVTLACLPCQAQPAAPQPQVAPAPKAPADLPAGAADAIKLTKAGLSEDVILAQIKNWNQSYTLTADQVIYLNSAGVSASVIKALMAPLPADAAPATPADQSPGSAPAPAATTQSAPSSTPPPPAPAAPALYSITVSAQTRWADAGVDVNPDQVLSFNASGQVDLATSIPVASNVATPAGLPHLALSEQATQALPAPGLTAAALVAKIGLDGTSFEIGTNAIVNVASVSSTGGHLYLSVNTDRFGPQNQGSWQVALKVEPIPEESSPQALVSESPAPSPVGLPYFQEQLAPYGQWIQTPNGLV